MVAVTAINKTNKAGREDWLEVSKGLIINAYVEESPMKMTASSESIFTKSDFELALKKVSRKVKK